MTYLYHRVPEDLQGNILYPLNVLKDENPELYTKKAKKYEGREYTMEQFIPTLKCLWNDVLHLSAINPKELKEALIEAGMKSHEMKFYQIDPSILEPEKTTVYLYQHTQREDKLKLENFAKYIPDKLGEYSVLPQATKDYYK